MVLEGRLLDPRRVDEVDVTALFPAHYGKGVGDTLTLQLPTPAAGRPGLRPVLRPAAAGAEDQGAHRRRDPLTLVLRLARIPRAASSRRPRCCPLPRQLHGRAMDARLLNALVRLKGGEAAIPRFRADLARVTGRNDIDDLGQPRQLRRPGAHKVHRFEAACLLAFGLAALAAALFLVGQSIARYTAGHGGRPPGAAGGGHDPAAGRGRGRAAPFLAAVAGATAGRGGRDRGVARGCRSARPRCSSRTRGSARTG